MARPLLAIVIAATWAFTLAAQSQPRFEVVSVQPSRALGLAELQIDERQARFSNLSLKDYIGIAYGLPIHQISGPDWLGSDRFEIVATIPENHASAEIPSMMRALLEDRFQMRTHRESREFDVYGLEVTSGGSPLVRAPDKTPTWPFTISSRGAGDRKVVDLGNGATLTLGGNRVEANGVTMGMLADTLARFVNRPVVNMTNLEGRYDVAFELASADFQALVIRSAVAGGVTWPLQTPRRLQTESVAAVLDAVERVGLQLRPHRASLDVLVIDGVERTPTVD